MDDITVKEGQCTGMAPLFFHQLYIRKETNANTK